MSIFNTNPDPDYPVNGGPGFIQHTCQPYNIPTMQQQFYYNGQSVAPVQQTPTFGYQQPQTDSRRYDAQPTAVPQSTPTFGFNQLVESRRNMPAPVQTPTQPTNPWAVQPVAQPAQPVMIPAPQQEAYYPSMYDSKYSSLYTCHPGFDKKQGAWGTQELYTTITPPTVNWGASAPVIPQNVPQYGYMNSQPMPQFPQATSAQPIQPSWEEIAKNTWK